MKIKDLKEKLDRLDPEMEVVLSCEDENIQQNNSFLVLFEIQSVCIAEAEKTRVGDGKPYLKLGKSEHSSQLAVIEITADF